MTPAGHRLFESSFGRQDVIHVLTARDRMKRLAEAVPLLSARRADESRRTAFRPLMLGALLGGMLLAMVAVACSAELHLLLPGLASKVKVWRRTCKVWR